MVDTSARGAGSAPLLAGSAMLELFQILRDRRPRTRSELAALTGLSRTTVATRVDALMELGLVGPVGGATSTGGRPSTQFSITASERFVVGVDVGASHVGVAIADLTGRVQAEARTDIAVAAGPDAVLGWVHEAIAGLLAANGKSEAELLAIGVGVPGPVEHSTGMPVNPPIMPGWDRYDIVGRLGGEFGVPVLVDNDVNIMALGERRFAWPEVDDLFFVKVATGVGSGIVSGGVLQRGAQGSAGDIGHVHVPNGADVPCVCGNSGCLEAIASGPAIARALREAGTPAETTEDVLALVRGGDLGAIRAMRQAGRDVGAVLATCVSLLNPSVIVIGGAVAKAGDQLIAGVREVVYQRSLPLATEQLQITLSRAGAEAALAGAAVLAIDHVLSPGNVEAMVERSLR